MSAHPYPTWIAHRGAGLLAPENTLAAMRRATARGYRMAECDVQLSADGVPVLLHDATLERTTNGRGPVLCQPWSNLSRLDAGSWHSAAYAGEPVPSLEAVSRACTAAGLRLNLEIKPAPGAEALTGEAVARAAAGLWPARDTWPLLTSFSTAALAAARRAAPHLPCGLLLKTWWSGWEAAAVGLRCSVIVAHQTIWDAMHAQAVLAAGWTAVAYTVNDATAAERLQACGVQCLITDEIDRFGP